MGKISWDNLYVVMCNAAPTYTHTHTHTHTDVPGILVVRPFIIADSRKGQTQMSTTKTSNSLMKA